MVAVRRDFFSRCDDKSVDNNDNDDNNGNDNDVSDDCDTSYDTKYCFSNNEDNGNNSKVQNYDPDNNDADNNTKTIIRIIATTAIIRWRKIGKRIRKNSSQ